MDVACFCGCRFSCGGHLGTCPGCGEYVSLSRVSDADEKQMRAELDLVVTHGAAAHRRRLWPAGDKATWSMSFPTSAEPALLAVAPRRQDRIRAMNAIDRRASELHR